MKIVDLEREGQIKRLQVNRKKIEDTFDLAKRDIGFAQKIRKENFDWTFAIAYNAMLQASRALMFFYGYRPSGEKQHISVVRFAETILGDEFRKEITVFDRLRRKRHIIVYDTAGSISEYEADFAVKSAEKFIGKIEEILKETHIKQKK